jgi:hypothetical protein
MRSVLISGNGAIPPELRHLVEQGSTSTTDCQAGELTGASVIVGDRFVFWAISGDDTLRALAERYAAAEAAERKEMLVFVSPDADVAPPAGLSPAEVFRWPADEDRLRMAFLTGA